MLLSPLEAAKKLGISRATLDRLRIAGEIPSLKVGGSRRYRVDAVIAYVDHAEAVAHPKHVDRLVADAVAQGHPTKVTDSTVLAKVAAVVRPNVVTS